ncbi:hypothetical protein YN1HA_19270 [Sulfurisphaera ohwakuensis]
MRDFEANLSFKNKIVVLFSLTAVSKIVIVMFYIIRLDSQFTNIEK